MKLGNLAISTGVVGPHDAVRAVFGECVRADVGGLPYVEDGVIKGRISIRHIMREQCIPSFMRGAAHLVGDQAQFNLDRDELEALLARPALEFLLPARGTVSSNTTVIRGMALMEQLDTSYLFVVDEGVYQGVITRMLIASRMLDGIRPDETL